MLKAAFTAPLLLLAATPALADASAVPTLTLTAEGNATRAPDLAVFSAGVSSTGTNAGAAMAANAAAMTRVIAALKATGIEERDIQTSSLSLNPVYEQRADNQAYSTPARIVGYQAGNSVSIRVRKLDTFGKVIDTLVSAGATNVNGPDFQLENPDAAQDDARRDAVAKARVRAELYASAAGLKVVRILSINEGGQDGGSVARPFNSIVVTAMKRAPTPIQAGEQDITAQVTIIFELAGQLEIKGKDARAIALALPIPGVVAPQFPAAQGRRAAGNL